MINIDKEYFNPPYYFFIKNNNEKYSIYFSINNTITEAREKDAVVHFGKKSLGKVKKFVKDLVKSKKKINTKKLKGEIEELVGSDGGMLSSKIPTLDMSKHTHRTMDQIVPASRQTNDPVTRGYRTYYGEGIDEIDMSDAFGYEETKNLDGKKTYKYLVDKLNVDPDEAKKRTKQFGKDPSGKKTKNKKKGSIDKMTLFEFNKMVEDLIVAKKNKNVDLQSKKDEPNPIIKKNIKTLKLQAEKEGLSINDLVKMLKNE